MRNPSIEKDRSGEITNVNNNETLLFHTESETNSASYKNRINQLYGTRNNIEQLMNRHGLKPSTDYQRFLKLKTRDALSGTIASEIATSARSPIISSTLSDAESATITAAVESMQATEFVQLFLDTYMSPLGSDIDYRLGKVVGIKEYFYNNNGKVIPNHEVFGQYDEYGRIDTTLNLRLETEIPGIGSYRSWTYRPGRGWEQKTLNVVPPYKEHYVNFFFPPYTANNFSDSTSLSYNVDYYIKTRRWDNKEKKWIYENAVDIDSITYDTAKLLSMRKNPTYRLPAYKAINDNISFLQHIFEQCTGIVSTYLTEWDISIYIQEGLLSGKEGKAPSYLTLTNRIMEDNPSGYRDTRALAYGALNCAVSKTPMEGVPVPNVQEWTPSTFPYSVYWLNYLSTDRGDGLDLFYTVALDGFNSTNLSNYARGDGNRFSANHYGQLKLREKIMRDDQMGAAYSGWLNWDSLQYWQALYTTPDDGLSSVDIIHMGLDAATATFENLFDKDGTIDGTIKQIIDALYAENDDLGFDKSEYDVKETLANGDILTTTYRRNAVYPYTPIVIARVLQDKYGVEKDLPGQNVSDVDEGEDCDDYKILRVRIKGSRILKLFLKRSSKQQAAMGIAKKEKNSGFATAMSNSSANNGSSNSNQNNQYGQSGTGGGVIGGNGNSNSIGGNGNSSGGPSFFASMVDANADENSRYSRDTGVSQWSPALYGGPHGRNLNPRTVEGYFEKDNEFLRNVPRLQAGNLSSNANQNFQGLEERYAAIGANAKGGDPYRSPSRCRSLLQVGHCDFTQQAIYCLMRHWLWSSTPYGYINGNWFHSIGRGWVYETEGTGYLTPVSFMCNPYNSDYYPNCPHYYWNAWYEWNNWNRYAHYYGGSSYWYNWYWNWYYDSWRESYSLSYSKDYWGRMGYLCIWSSERYSTYGYNSWYTTRHYHGQCGVYQLKAHRARYVYYCTYTQWETYYMKRPLMHSNPNASNNSLWTLANGYIYHNVWCKWYGDHWWWRYWAKWSKHGLPARYSPTSAHSTALSVSYAYSRHNGYRLTFPYSGNKYYNSTAYGHADIRKREDMRFMEYVTGNSETGWHDVYLFESSPGTTFSDRYRNGPNLIFKVPVRRNTYVARYWEWYLVSHKHKCHRDWCWHRRIIIGHVPYIEVNMDKVERVLTGFKQEGNDSTRPWNNIDALMYAGKHQEANIDVPPESTPRAKLTNSPFGLSTFPVWEGLPTQEWAHIGRDSNEYIMFGWGYATAFPGIEYFNVNPPENVFENPNDYMNIEKIYGSRVRNIRMQDISRYYPFYTLDNNLPLRYVVPPEAGTQHNFIAAQGVKRYSRIWTKDPGIRNMIRNIFSTSTFFRFKEPPTSSPNDISNYLYPVITMNDVGLRVLIKSANHELAWVRKAFDVFKDLDWKEIRKLIEKTVNKNILSKTLPSSNSRDESSIYYHYWIEKAYKIFSDDSSKVHIQNAFYKKINRLSEFVNKMSRYVGMTSYSWSYSDYEYIYNEVRALRYDFHDNKDETIDDFMYAYLNVLYEYRKFYINSRCNKVDGTLYRMRELEGAIPLVCQQIEQFNPYDGTDEPNIFEDNSHTYRVSYYDIDNSNLQKIKSVNDKNLKLKQDRTMLLYLKVKYVDKSVALSYLEKCKNGTPNSKDQRYIWIPQKQQYAELPFDDTYRYESREYTTNEAAKAFNERVTVHEQKQVREDIDDCIFKITWTSNSVMDSIKNAKSAEAKASLQEKLGEGNNFPYVYKELPDWKSRSTVQKNGVSLPKIKFDVQSGVDPVKLIEAQKELQSQPNGTYTAFDIICTVGSKTDYWVVAIPPSERPRAVGYVSNLKIKSWRNPEIKNVKSNGQTDATAGAFGYTLYPVTEEQAHTIPGIGLDIAGLQDNLKNSYLSNFDDNIEKLDRLE